MRERRTGARTQRPFLKQITSSRPRCGGDYDLGGVNPHVADGLFRSQDAAASIENDGTPYHGADSPGIEGPL